MKQTLIAAAIALATTGCAYFTIPGNAQQVIESSLYQHDEIILNLPFGESTKNFTTGVEKCVTNPPTFNQGGAFPGSVSFVGVKVRHYLSFPDPVSLEFQKQVDGAINYLVVLKANEEQTLLTLHSPIRENRLGKYFRNRPVKQEWFVRWAKGDNQRCHGYQGLD